MRCAQTRTAAAGLNHHAQRPHAWLWFAWAALATILTAGCDKPPAENSARWTDTAAPAAAPARRRWYTAEQVAAGAVLYREHCAACHKANAEGTTEWRQRDANGNLPPPPLNGTAHAWHHPLDILRSVVRAGGQPVGGSMPPFVDKLSPAQIDAVLAWVQSHWSERIYAVWEDRDKQAR